MKRISLYYELYTMHFLGIAFRLSVDIWLSMLFLPTFNPFYSNKICRFSIFLQKNE